MCVYACGCVHVWVYGDQALSNILISRERHNREGDREKKTQKAIETRTIRRTEQEKYQDKEKEMKEKSERKKQGKRERNGNRLELKRLDKRRTEVLRVGWSYRERWTDRETGQRDTEAERDRERHGCQNQNRL